MGPPRAPIGVSLQPFPWGTACACLGQHCAACAARPFPKTLTPSMWGQEAACRKLAARGARWLRFNSRVLNPRIAAYLDLSISFKAFKSPRAILPEMSQRRRGALHRATRQSSPGHGRAGRVAAAAAARPWPKRSGGQRKGRCS